MRLSLSAELVHLEIDASGVVRVEGTHVSFDTVIYVSNEGSTLEEFARPAQKKPIKNSWLKFDEKQGLSTYL